MASVLEVAGGAKLEIDDDAGVAWLRGAKPVEYGQRYWDECLEYHNSPLAETLTRLRVELVSRHAGPIASLVDVGIGSGRFLEAWVALARNHLRSFEDDARPAAFVRGVDTNPIAQEWLRSRGFLIDQVELAGGEFRFAAVTLWDVFEHLAEPAGLLDLIPAGRKLFLSLPIYRDFRGLERSKHYKPGEHLSYWTHDGLVRYFKWHGYRCLESNDLETQAGRESIRSYAFERVGGVAANGFSPSLLITNGIGDFLAAESFWPESKRRELETVYYATRQWRPIRELLEAFAKRNFPNLKHHVVLWEEFDEAEAFCFTSAGDVTQKVRVPPGVEDFSIARVFPEVTEGLLHHTGSTALRYELADVEHLELPERFVVVCPTTDDPTPVGRNFFPADWGALVDWLERQELPGVVLGQPPTDGDWLAHRQTIGADNGKPFLDLRGHTSLLESIEVLKRASGYVGIDSCLSVLAARLFRFPRLMIKCVRPTGGIAWKHVYWYPRAPFLAPPEKTPFIGASIAEIVGRAST